MSRKMTVIYIDNLEYIGYEAAANALGCDRSHVRNKLVTASKRGTAKHNGHIISLLPVEIVLKVDKTEYAPRTHRRGDQLLSKRPEAWYGIGRGEA